MHLRLSYLVLTLASLGLLTTLIPLLGKPVFEFGWFVTFVISASLIAPIAHWEWRKNRRSLAIFGVVMASIPLVVSVSVLVFFADEGIVAAWGVLGVSVALSAWFARVLWLEYRLRDRVPNGLSERFLDEDTFEDDGVQWAVQTTGHDAASPLAAIVHLQNNIDAERNVVIRLRPEAGFVGSSKCVHIAAIPEVSLRAAAEATVTIPFVASETRPRKKITIYVYVRGKGPPGPRNRRQRVGPGPRPMSRWLMVFGVLAGHFSFQRGGMRIALRSSGAASPQMELEPTHVDVREPEAEPEELFGGAVVARSGVHQ